jgi:GNAT superfamily N-acetyltransferase
MTTRAATLNDLPALLQMGRAFFDESGFGAETSLDAESLEKTLRYLIESGEGAVFVAERTGAIVGCAGALRFPYYFNLACSAAQELFWWIAPEHRGSILGVRLLQALERWARDSGCATLTMISLPALEDSPAAALYRRMGYRPSEHNFIKRVN